LCKKLPGKGIERIKNAGIEVTGPEELKEILGYESFKDLNDRSEYLNRVFFKSFRTANRIQTGSANWITLKTASTADGRMVTREDEARWITNSESRRLVHRMRSCHEILLTGIGTVLEDDPEFNVRHSPEELNLSDIRNPELVIFKSSRDFGELERSRLKIFQNKIKPREIKINDRESSNELKELIEEISSNKPRRIMLEAGPTLSDSFLEAGLFDEIVHFEVLDESLELEKQIYKILERYSKKSTERIELRHYKLIHPRNPKESTDIQIFIKKIQASDLITDKL
jgi:diaminohydroxyphosphoribosylaminopyrimidine deaminase / 5-amino-6-(5-phosphoribosylamino)uracil reductase